MPNDIYRHIFIDIFLIKLMINSMNCSMLASTSTSDDDEVNTGISKSTRLEYSIKYLMKGTRIGHRSSRNLVRRGHNIILKYP